MLSLHDEKTGIARDQTWALASRCVFTPTGLRDAVVVVRGEWIQAVVDRSELPAGVPVEDVGEKAILPGLIDSHVHVNEPGRTDWEGFTTATRAAAAGGVTTIVDMPLNSSPVTTTPAALARKWEAATGKLRVDCGFYGGVVPGNLDQIDGLMADGVLGFKAFLCHSGLDEFPNVTADDLRPVMRKLAIAELPLLVHAELVGPLPPGVEEAFAVNPQSYRAYRASRPPEWELNAIRLMIDLCRETRCPVHIVHLATAEGLPLINAAKAEGLPLTVETCPHYLAFGGAHRIPDGNPRFKCAPPIRDGEWLRLWRGVFLNQIDTIGTDHSPAPPDMKFLETGDLRRAWGGIASLQLMLPVVYHRIALDSVKLHNLPIHQMSRNPARLLGLTGRKGEIAGGHDADLIVINEEHWIVRAKELQHRHPITPYDGQEVRGQVERTYLRGRLVYDTGCFPGEPSGQIVTRQPCRPSIT